MGGLAAANSRRRRSSGVRGFSGGGAGTLWTSGVTAATIAARSRAPTPAPFGVAAAALLLCGAICAVARLQPRVAATPPAEPLREGRRRASAVVLGGIVAAPQLCRTSISRALWHAPRRERSLATLAAAAAQASKQPPPASRGRGHADARLDCALLSNDERNAPLFSRLDVQRHQFHAHMLPTLRASSPSSECVLNSPRGAAVVAAA